MSVIADYWGLDIMIRGKEKWLNYVDPRQNSFSVSPSASLSAETVSVDWNPIWWAKPDLRRRERRNEGQDDLDYGPSVAIDGSEEEIKRRPEKEDLERDLRL